MLERVRKTGLFAALFAFTSLSAATPHAAAQEQNEAVPSVTFAEMLRRAQQDPPAVFVAHAALEQARTEHGSAQAEWLPALAGSARAGYTYEHGAIAPNTPAITTQSIELRGALNLEWAALDLARGSRIDATEAGERARTFELEASRTRAALLAADLYLRAGAASELVKDAQLSLERRTQQQAAAEQLVRGGTRSPLDAQRAKVETVSAQYVLTVRRTEELAAFAALAAALGRPADSMVRPASNTEALRVVAQTPARAKELARANRPELRGANANATAAQYARDAAVNERWPTLGAAADGSASNVDVRSGFGIEGDRYAGSAAIYVRWQGLDPVVWGRGSVARAAANVAQRERDALEHAIAGEAVGAYYAFERAKVLRERAVAVLEAAQVTREAQNGRYAAGLASLLELLDAEELEQRARQARIEAERDEVIAVAQLQSACGLLTH